jgi:hypothetical protein
MHNHFLLTTVPIIIHCHDSNQESQNCMQCIYVLVRCAFVYVRVITPKQNRGIFRGLVNVCFLYVQLARRHAEVRVLQMIPKHFEKDDKTRRPTHGERGCCGAVTQPGPKYREPPQGRLGCMCHHPLS